MEKINCRFAGDQKTNPCKDCGLSFKPYMRRHCVVLEMQKKILQLEIENKELKGQVQAFVERDAGASL